MRGLEIVAITKVQPVNADADAIQVYPTEPMPAEAVAQGMFNTTPVCERLAAMPVEVSAINDDWSGKAASPTATVEAALARVTARFGAVPAPPERALSR